MFRHRLLHRQIRKHLGLSPSLAPETRALLQAVEAAYDQFDTDRKLVERSMELSSQELIAVNARLRQQNERHVEVLDRLRDSVRALQIDGTSAPGAEEDLLQVAALLQKQVRLLHESAAALKLNEFSVQEASLPTFWIARDARILRVNRAGCDLLGYAEAELLQLAITDLDPDFTPERWPAHWEELRARKRMFFETRQRHKSGRLIPIEVDLNWLEYEGREYNFAFIRDISERQRAEGERQQLDRKVQETQKLESLGVLAGGIAHDFNNILTIVLGNASLARLQLPEGSPVQKNLEAIAHGSRRAGDLCKQMLAYSGKGRFVLQNLSLNRLVEETTHLLQISISKKAALHLRLHPALPAIKADATQIRQVIMNLVINASEAMGEKNGVISISTGVAAVGREHFAGSILTPELPEGDYVYLEVADSGGGMSPETQAKIFDPFFTTKFTGRGLGLAAVLGIVRGHQGALKLHSELGRGTTFKMLFPVSDAAEDLAAAAEEKPAWRGQGCVLVADDEESVRSITGAMLGMVGFEVVLAADGSDAMDRFRQEPDRFALVLLDLTMPRLDGKQAFMEIRRLRPEQRIVVMSGFNEQETVAQFGSKALAYFLHKPFESADLVGVAQRALEGGPPAEVDGRPLIEIGGAGGS